jgi:hypothetical protein
MTRRWNSQSCPHDFPPQSKRWICVEPGAWCPNQTQGHGFPGAQR